MEKTRLLVIDDNEALVDMIEEYFSSHELINIAFKAYTGEEGINLIEKNLNDYDVIILDLIMPKKDGIYVLEEMKKRNINIDLIKCIAVFSVISVHYFTYVHH
mgnify:CR=1 FL=1